MHTFQKTQPFSFFQPVKEKRISCTPVVRPSVKSVTKLFLVNRFMRKSNEFSRKWISLYLKADCIVALTICIFLVDRSIWRDRYHGSRVTAAEALPSRLDVFHHRVAFLRLYDLEHEENLQTKDESRE